MEDESEDSDRHPESHLGKGVPGVLVTGQEGEPESMRGEGHVAAGRPEVGLKDRWTVWGESAGWAGGMNWKARGNWSLPPLSSAGLPGPRGTRAVMW